MKVYVLDHSYWLWCPACDDAVRINDSWTWNGDVDKPTFTPSLLTRYGHGRRCHSFVTDGQWNYLADSTHKLAGRSVPMVDFPLEWLHN